MQIYNKIHVLLSALSYIFRRLLRRLQGEVYRMFKTIVLTIRWKPSCRRVLIIIHVVYCIRVFCWYIQEKITI
jgi:hypothetical protein